MRHPEDSLLLEYSAGVLSEAEELLIAAHLSLCADCRARVVALDAVGGALLEASPSTSHDRDAASLAAVLFRLSEPAPVQQPVPAIAPALADLPLPAPLRDVVARAGIRSWSTVVPLMVQQITLPIVWAGAPVRLTRVRGGFRVPNHTHRGRELNLVLAGGFHDHRGGYGPGDVTDSDERVTHALSIDRGEDCIILAVNEAPLVPVGLGAQLASWLTGF